MFWLCDEQTDPCLRQAVARATNPDSQALPESQHENTAFLPLFGLPKPSSEDGLILSFETLFPGRMWSWRRWWVQLSFWRYMLQVTAV